MGVFVLVPFVFSPDKILQVRDTARKPHPKRYSRLFPRRFLQEPFICPRLAIIPFLRRSTFAQSLRACQALPLQAVTAVASNATQEAAFKAGVNGHLVKPLSFKFKTRIHYLTHKALLLKPLASIEAQMHDLI